MECSGQVLNAAYSNKISSGLNLRKTRSPIPAFMTSSCSKPDVVFTTSASKLTTSCAQSCVVWVKAFSDTDRSTGHLLRLHRRENHSMITTMIGFQSSDGHRSKALCRIKVRAVARKTYFHVFTVPCISA